MKKASIDGLIRKSMSARVRKLPGDCPDENAFAAYSEHRLSQQEIALFESHLAGCDSCQNALALGMKLCDPDAATHEGAVPERKRVLFRFSIPAPVFGVAVAAIILVAVCIRLFHDPGGGKRAPTPTVEPNALVLAIEPAEPKASPPAPIAIPNASAENRTRVQRNAPGKKEVVALQNQEKGIAADFLPVPQSAQDTAKASDLAPMESKAAAADLINIPTVSPAPASGSLGGGVDIPAGGTTASLMPTPELGSPEGNRDILGAGKAVSLPPPPPPMSADVARAGGGFGMGATPSRAGGMGGFGGMGGGMGTAGGAGAGGRGGMGGFGGFGGGDGFGGVPANRGSNNVPAPKKIGDKEFYFNSGWWIDRQARYKPDDSFIDITSADPEYESILAQYKQLRNLRPVLIYWKNEFYIMR